MGSSPTRTSRAWRRCRRTPACKTPTAVPESPARRLTSPAPWPARPTREPRRRRYALAVRTAPSLPVKRCASAKQRLGASVADPLRVELARAMVGDVLAALEQTASIERTIVVTQEESVAGAAGHLGALVLADLSEDGPSTA